ncbi:hypothetical protein GSI_07483 [Ganoderma sinense ZZ0214-1]|uniref:SHSP domain-containing protein n=1 Tax=Ganoderma sinense ZZ0214-1 TaxID=1077348 RepID=A0A2G8S972_9APHY|nr:hypothetical protein GSI_07483 [Ganoderma sinense ZZ0214-1]
MECTVRGQRATSSPPKASHFVPASAPFLRILTGNARVDVREDKEKNLVSAMFELPGVNKESLSVGVHKSLLTVSGESRSESGSSGNVYLLRERRFGHFSRSITVPEGIKPGEIKASMENGVLTVTYPRHASEQISKKIAVS